MSSPPAPKMLAHWSLLLFEETIQLVDEIHGLPEGPDKTEMLTALRDGLIRHRPVLRGVIRAQEQAAQALNLSQSPSVRVLASIGVPQPHPDAANSHASPPHQPTPGVA